MEENIVEKICGIRRDFERLMASYSDDAGFVDSIRAALEENGLLSEDKIRAEYAKKVDSNRLLKIGIVGAVKAGKSSLLNALFFDGADILPKAATPMTAALTELTYGEQHSVTVDFFTESDIEELKKKSAEYKRKFEEEKSKALKTHEENWLKNQKRRNPSFSGSPEAKDRKLWEDMAHQSATTELKKDVRLSSAYEQYQIIEKSAIARKTESETFSVNSLSEIAGRLEDYVGSNGKYMPFTSKVSIALPLESLQGIAVIDTPGFNDPVPSRDDRARQALRECDVIFILSKSTPFLGKEDMKVISKITKSKGDRNLYLVASQVDEPLIAKENKAEAEKIADENADDVLDAVIKVVSDKNCNTARGNLRNGNESGVFEDLITDTEAHFFFTSGQCESMARTFADRSNWDSGKKNTWKNLCKWYPDYFSDSDEDTSIASLKKLGNIERIREGIDKEKERKAETFERGLANFGKEYTAAANEARVLILRDLDERETELQKRDIGQLEEEIKRLQTSYADIAPELDDAFIETVSDWYGETQSDYESRLADARGDVKSALKSHEGETTNTWTTGHLWWKEYHSETLTTVNSTAVKNSIADYIDDYNGELPHYLETEIYRLTKKVVNNVQKVWTEKDVAASDSTTALRNRVRLIMTELTSKAYDLEYTGGGFSFSGGYSSSSHLEGSSADECISQANDFVSNLNRTFKGKLKTAIDDVLKSCKNYAFSKNVLDSYQQRLEKMKADIEKPKLAIENFRRMRKEVEAIAW